MWAGAKLTELVEMWYVLLHPETLLCNMMLAVPTKHIALQYARVQLAGKSITYFNMNSHQLEICVSSKSSKLPEIIKEAVLRF